MTASLGETGSAMYRTLSIMRRDGLSLRDIANMIQILADDLHRYADEYAQECFATEENNAII